MSSVAIVREKGGGGADQHRTDRRAHAKHVCSMRDGAFCCYAWYRRGPDPPSSQRPVSTTSAPSSVAALRGQRLLLPLTVRCCNVRGQGAVYRKQAVGAGRGLAATGEGRTAPDAAIACLASSVVAMVAAVCYVRLGVKPRKGAGCGRSRGVRSDPTRTSSLTDHLRLMAASARGLHCCTSMPVLILPSVACRWMAVFAAGPAPHAHGFDGAPRSSSEGHAHTRSMLGFGLPTAVQTNDCELNITLVVTLAACGPVPAQHDGHILLQILLRDFRTSAGKRNCCD